MGFLLSFIFFVFIIAVVVLLFALRFLRSIFGFGGRKNPFAEGRNLSEEEKERYNPFNNSKKQKKMIDKHEGEYVDYEEMK